MNTRKILIGSGVAVALVAGATVAWSTASPGTPGYVAGVVAQKVHYGGWRGHRGPRGARGMAALCSDRRDRGVENGLAFVEGFVNFTPEQTAAWKELSAAVRAGSATIGEKCKEMEKAGMPETAPAKLARFDEMATTGLAILKRIRPTFDRFYATLSEKQKKALDSMLSRHRGR